MFKGGIMLAVSAVLVTVEFFVGLLMIRRGYTIIKARRVSERSWYLQVGADLLGVSVVGGGLALMSFAIYMVAFVVVSGSTQ